MNRDLFKKIALVSGIATILIPLLITVLWQLYIKELAVVAQVTPEGECVPYAVFIDSENNNQLVVTWKTKNFCAGSLILSPDSSLNSEGSKKIIPLQGEVPTKEFTVTISEAESSQLLYAFVLSDGQSYGVNGKPFRLK